MEQQPNSEFSSEDDVENPKGLSELRRQRSARRLRHEAQVKVFERQAGSLEDIRMKLGMRPSQICELLKVHPSAWTRWTRTGKAPPHVFQMLDWYLELLRWRGQHGTTPTEDRLQAVGKEDPEAYVPPTNSATSLQSNAEPEIRNPTSVLGPITTPKFLTIMWLAQTLLAVAIIILLLTKA
jgi:hypothetical protein